MKFTQSFKMAFSSIWGNKMRSFLTMLGVIIGVFAVVVLVSVVQGATSSVTSELEAMGTNTIQVSATSYRNPMRLEDVAELSTIQGVQYCAPTLSSNTTVRGNGNSFTASLIGSTEDYLPASRMEVEDGRNMSASDLENRFQVAIIGTEVADEIFAHRDVVGLEITLGGRTYTIIGLIEEQEESLMGSSNNTVLIPITTAERMLQTKDIRSVLITTLDSSDISPVKADLERKMEKLVGEDNYNVFASQDLLDTMNSAIDTLTLMLGGIAGISLVVGGVGIMNIMLVSVTERTREIGIRKAIGAKRRDILGQFLIEAVVITVLGGIIAIILSYGALIVLGDYMGIPMSMSGDTVTLGIGFCLVIGLVFGIHPANKASKLNPIEALRHE